MGPLIDLLPLSYTDAVVAIAAVTLGAVAGVVGTFAVLRERSLAGDALAHAALPGVCAAFLLTGVKEAAGLLAGAAVAGLLGAVLVLGLERGGRLRPDAAIGVVLSSFFSLGIVLLTAIANSNDADQAGLDRYLFGQAAGLAERDVTVTGVIGLVTLTVVALLFRPLKAALFDPAYAASSGLPARAMELLSTALLVVAVVVGVRMVGAILMVAMLVIPATLARQFTDRLALLLPLAGLCGSAVGVTGALLSARAELPTGPVIVLVGTAAVLVALALAPGRGVLWHARRLRRDRRRALVDGVLLDLDAVLRDGPPPTDAELAALGTRPRRALRRALGDLARAGLVAREHGHLLLTDAGGGAARALVERRAEWALWLEHGWRLELPDAREPDPRDLRGSLGDEAADRLLAFGSRTA